jgi:small subunit ribosomal protein S20
MRQSVKRRTRNRIERGTLRSALRNVSAATSQDDAKSAYSTAERLLDRAAGKNLIHLNKAARHKSRLQALIANLSA